MQPASELYGKELSHRSENDVTKRRTSRRKEPVILFLPTGAPGISFPVAVGSPSTNYEWIPSEQTKRTHCGGVQY